MLATRQTQNMTKSRTNRGRSNASDRGGIRKRGAPATRVDRDGDLAMGVGSERGRGGRHTRGQARDARKMDVDHHRTLNTIQKAIAGDTNAQVNIRRGTPKGGPWQEISITGWKSSKAATNSDGGVSSLLGFLERKLSPSNAKTSAKSNTLITKSRLEGDVLIVSVRPEHMDRLLNISGFTFAGAPLTIEPYNQSLSDNSSISTDDTKTRLTRFLSNRFDAQSKTLNLANLGGDPILTDMGLFNSTKTESKFFQALMKLWTLNFETDQQSREAVESLSLANDQLTSIQHISILSQHFPRLKHLDLSNNQIKDYKDIVGWRWKFRQLEFLDLLNNKISEDHTFKDTMMKWYPNLKILNNVQIRTDQEVAAHHRSSIPVQPPLFQDDSQIAQNFIPYFFTGFDSDRDNLLNSVYDNNSTFSFNVNTNAPRGAQDTITPAGWDNYIKKSRNLMRISHLSARMSRIHVGVEKIRELWRALPHTRHPNIATNPEQWLVECYPLSAVPDPTGQIASGVGGLLIMVHSSFQESGDAKTLIRSFDRTLVLGPGGGAGAVRVVSDMLTLRAYGGHTAWDPEGQMSISTSVNAVPIVAPQINAAPGNPAIVAPAVPVPDHPEAPQGYGKPAPSKSADDLQKEQKILQLSFGTRMTLFYSQMALENNNWDTEAALKAFEAAKVQGNIPQEAFIPGV